MTKSNARKAKIFIFRVRLVMLTNAMGLDKLIQAGLVRLKEIRRQFRCINQRDLVYTVLQVISILFVALNGVLDSPTHMRVRAYQTNTPLKMNLYVDTFNLSVRWEAFPEKLYFLVDDTRVELLSNDSNCMTKNKQSSHKSKKT